MTKTILQVVQHLKPGGIETMALDLQHHLGHNTVHIVSLEGTEKDALAHWGRLQERRPQLHFLNKKAGFQFMTVLKLMALIRRLKVSAVHTHHIGPLTYGGLAARLCGVRHLVHTEHDAWHLKAPKAAALQRKLLRWLRPELVADCTYVAERLQDFSPHAKPSVIYNGIDTDRFRPASLDEKIQARITLDLPLEAPVIGCAARLEKVKGVAHLIAAMSFLPPNAYLAIAGDGSLKEQLIRQTHFITGSERILFLGRVEDMKSFYDAIDVFCLPSLNEGFPLSPLEAQACDIPAVITDVGGARETLCPKTGLLVAPSDPHALTRALAQKLYSHDVQDPRPFVRRKADIRLMIAAYSKLLAC